MIPGVSYDDGMAGDHFSCSGYSCKGRPYFCQIENVTSEVLL